MLLSTAGTERLAVETKLLSSEYLAALSQGSATLSMAYAGALFADACLRGLEGESNVEEYSYVASSTTELPFFSTKVTLGKKGGPLHL